MAYSAQNDSGEKKQAPLWAMIAAGVALLGLMGWWGYKNFGPQDPPLTSENVATQNMLDELAKKCQGDFSKLTPEEQEKAKKVAGPFAGLAIASTYQKFKK
jgi:hypothetical protein